LDVETVEALADALCRYQGTVIFTSHDRHFMHKVATAVIEVRDGRVASYPANYDDYVYRIRKELEAGLRSEHTVRGLPPSDGAAEVGNRPLGGREERELQKKLKSVERKIARLDEEKQAIQARLLETTDPRDAQSLHEQLAALTTEVETHEEEWLSTYNELEA
jgi:ATP-binding cassette subfamily F protein 3